MLEPQLKLGWHIGSFPLGTELESWERLKPEDVAACSSRAADLLDEEAVVWNVDLNGSVPGLVLLWRERDEVLLATRQRLRPNEDLSELARVYSVVARGSDATVFTDAAAGLLAGSRYWRSIYGFQPNEVIGNNPRIINPRIQPSSFFKEMWRHLTDRSIGTWSAELVNRRKNGELVHVWQTITTVRGKDGTIQGYLGQTRDMTEIHAARRQLTRQNEELGKLNRFKGEMVEIMAHDLKAPLQAVLGFTDLVESSLAADTPDKLRRNVGRIRESGKNMLEMVQNFLQLQRSESGELTAEKERGHLRSLVRTIVEGQSVAGRARQVELKLEEAGPARPQYFDPVRIEQAVSNVISNAIKYTHPSTEVVVRILSNPGAPERIEVEDEGIGIPETDLEAVFEAYNQIGSGGKSTGSVGWGLAIARKVMDLHGGRIWVENRTSGGCLFILELPLGYDVFGKAPGAVLLHDPDETWCHAMLGELEKQSLPAFVSSGREELAALMEQEFPDTVLSREGAIPGLPAIESPDTGEILKIVQGSVIIEEGRIQRIHWSGTNATADRISKVLPVNVVAVDS